MYDRAHRKYDRPAVGDLTALAFRSHATNQRTHAVWRVIEVGPLERARWNEQDEDHHARYLAHLAELPEEKQAKFTWSYEPYEVDLEFVGGTNPMPRDGRGEQRTHTRVTVHAGESKVWSVYRDGRWPQCSCCGEPMPCSSEVRDRQVEAELSIFEHHAAKLPGCCWACCEPITARQQSVTYAGPNLDLPGGPEVMFHTRRRCRPGAERYEGRWRAEDPDRPRILTWPSCPGTLIVHGDGTSECFGGHDDCHGHDTHNHGCHACCLIQSHGCPRGCDGENHPGTRPRRRPNRGVRRTT
jgi:hypothetical protein